MILSACICFGIRSYTFDSRKRGVNMRLVMDLCPAALGVRCSVLISRASRQIGQVLSKNDALGYKLFVENNVATLLIPVANYNGSAHSTFF